MEDTINDNTVASESQEESRFAGVVFRNVQEIYIPGKDIRCCYSIKPSVSTTANDWIGLYKVGWLSPKEYLCYEYSPVIGNNDNDSSVASAGSLLSLSAQNSVVFRGNKLPTEECEFYQFCYVTSSGQIRGASYPFQINFSKPGDLECTEEEDENGDTLLIVKNRTTLLEDLLAKAQENNATLKASKENVEADRLKLQDMILKLEGKNGDLTALIEKHAKKLEKVVSEKAKIEEELTKSVEQQKASQQALKVANEKSMEIQQQLDNERLRQVQSSSEQQKFEEERSQLLHTISNKDDLIKNFLATIEENGVKASAMESEIEKLKTKNGEHQEEYDQIVNKLEKTEDSLTKSKQENSVLEKSLSEQFEQVSQLQAENSAMKDYLAATQKEMEDLSHSFGTKQASMEENHLTEIANLESQMEVMSSKLNEGQQNLVAVSEKLEEVYLMLDKEREVKQQQCEEFENSLLKLQEQLDQERAFNQSLSSGSDRQVAELQEQLNAVLEKNSSAMQEMKAQTQEIKRLEEIVNQKEKQIEAMKNEADEQVKKLELAKKRVNDDLQSNVPKDENAEKDGVLEGSYFALQTAYGKLTKQFLQGKKDMENLWRQKADLKRQLAIVQSELPDSDLRFQMANLKKQVEDLRIRLNMGAEAYKAKFKECRKYESQLKKIRKDSSGQSTPKSRGSSVEEFEIRNLKQSLENEKTSVAALKKSLENYKMEAHEAKEELEKTTKKSDLLQQEVSRLEQEAAISYEETQKRLMEDKELQSHIECLYSQLEARESALKEREESYKKIMEENQNLQDGLEEAAQQNKEVVAERDNLKQEMEKQNANIEELREMAGLIDAVAKHQEEKINEEYVTVSVEETIPRTSQTVPPDALHDRPQCPMCQTFYPPSISQEYFEAHVNEHFKE